MIGDILFVVGCIVGGLVLLGLGIAQDEREFEADLRRLERQTERRQREEARRDETIAEWT